LATKGEIKIGPIPFHLIKTFYDQVKAAGGDCKKLADDRYYFSYAGPLKSSKIETAPHPGFMTDWQPNWAVLMTQAKASL
jgi:UDP-N-acetylglucosamine 1-carboxyvinyltransferase